jgi:hypothetical protein
VEKDHPFIIWLSTNPVATWAVRRVASRIDPLIFKATHGRFTSMGAPSMPMLALCVSLESRRLLFGLTSA